MNKFTIIRHLTPDSDGDGLLDGEEIVQEFHRFGYDALAPFNPNNIYPAFNTHIVFTKRADPLDRDTDGDGLIDGEYPFPLAFNKYVRYHKEAAVRLKSGVFCATIKLVYSQSRR